MRLPKLSLTARTAAIALLATGLAAYSSGLSNPFMGDDNDQIVNNPAVHSLGHVGSFFTGGTFTGGGSSHLAGVYYRPLMITSFAVVYKLFGLSPVAYHTVQLVLFILGSFLVFLVLRYFLKPAIAFIAALIFLVHPLNSQSAFSIPNLQEPLYFDFGMAALWLLLRFRSHWALIATAGCLSLSLLSKETGLVFAGIALAYFAIFDRRRLLPFASAGSISLALYLALKLHAVGFARNAHVAPIDNLSLVARLSNIPVIIWHYLGLFLFPMKLASSYFWAYTTPSLAHFWLPLLGILALALLVLLAGQQIRRNLPTRAFLTYVFFLAWLVLGLLPLLQIIPLDMTAIDTWFFVSMVGLLGLLGLLVQEYLPMKGRPWVIAFVVIVITVFGMRTIVRGRDWNGNAKMAQADLKASPGNFVAQYQLANYFEDHAQYAKAENFAKKSIETFPTGSNWDVLGKTYMDQGKYRAANQAFNAGLNRQPIPALYQDSAALTLVYGSPAQNLLYLKKLTGAFPNNATILTALAVAQYRTGHLAEATKTILNARRINVGNASINKIYAEISRGQLIR